MPIPIRMTRAKARKYSFTGETKPEAKPQKSIQAHEDARRSEKAISIVIPAVGEKWRVAKGLRDHFCTPPPVGTVFIVWHKATDGKRIWMEGEGFSLSVTPYMLGRYFQKEEAETC